MIQPGMLAVVEQYQAVVDWVPTSTMTAYLAGGMFLQWLLGPLSDSGWSPSGDAGVWCVYHHLSGNITGANIEQFTLLRFLAGHKPLFHWRCGIRRNSGILRRGGLYQDHRADGERGADCSATWSAGGRGVDPCAALGGDVCFVCRIGSDLLFGLQRAIMPETATRIGEKLSPKELGRDYKLVLKNGRFVAGALALGFVSLPLLAWIAQSPIIIITGEQLSSYE